MRARALLIVAVLSLAPVLSGCLADLDRRVLDTSWDASAELHDGPLARADSQPAMLVVEGPIGLPEGASVSLTGVGGHLLVDGERHGLTPAHLLLGEREVDPDQVDDERPSVSNGLHVELSFVPAPGSPDRIGKAGNVSAEVELRYRFEEGNTFDAGRFTFEGNVTVNRTTGLGVGVAETEQGRVHAIVFEAIRQAPGPGSAQVQLYQVTHGGPERDARVNATLEPGVGVLRVVLEDAPRVPTGEGYLLLRLEGGSVAGVATVPFEPAEETIPGWQLPSLVAGVLAALALAHRRRLRD